MRIYIKSDLKMKNLNIQLRIGQGVSSAALVI